MAATLAEVLKALEHTLLKPEATSGDVGRLCAEAREHGFGGVCVAGAWVAEAAGALAGSGVRLVSVVGFPHGTCAFGVKAYETAVVVRLGAEEVDVPIHVGALKGGDLARVRDDLRSVVDAAEGRPVKAILETALLDRDEKLRACEIAEAAGARFVKTSTGYAPGGATVEDVALLRSAVGTRLGVKASGGIRDLATARAMLAAGAERLGVSAGVAIALEGRAKGRSRT